MNEGYRAWGAVKRGLGIKDKKCLYEGVTEQRNVV